MMTDDTKRVMARRLARELTSEECNRVSGGVHPPGPGEETWVGTGCVYIEGGAVVCSDHEHEGGGGGVAGVNASLN